MPILGVIGAGDPAKVGRRLTEKLLKDYLGANEVSLVLLPGTRPGFTLPVQYAADALDGEFDGRPDVVFLVDEHDFADIEGYRAVQTEVEGSAVERVVIDADVIIYAWDDDPTLTTLIDQALKNGKQVFELNDMLLPVRWESDELPDDIGTGEPVITETVAAVNDSSGRGPLTITAHDAAAFNDEAQTLKPMATIFPARTPLPLTDDNDIPPGLVDAVIKEIVRRLAK